MKVYIVDYLGIHCGMDYYLEAFEKILSQIPGIEVKILSNYSAKLSENPFFINQYKGNILKKGFSLVKNLLRLKNFIAHHQDDLFIYLSYGNKIDIPFLKIVSSAPNHIIDIHEGIAQDIDSDKKVLQSLKDLYSSRINCVISHSERTDNFLEEFEYKNHRFKVPHFRYVMSKDFDLQRVPEEVRNSIDPNRINLLFFGNLNSSKGVDRLIKAINLMPAETADKYNLVIAGKDFDSSVYKESPEGDRKVNIFARHITDDELKFLYGNADYICLPYRKTSQSGILEMALYFKKPIIATDIPYFKMVLTNFPTFGILAGNSTKEYAKTLEGLYRRNKNEFYSEEDIHNYENRPEISDFKKQLEEYLKTL